MRLLDRYLMREFLVPLVYCLCGFLLLWISFDLFSELHSMQEKHLRAGDIIQYYLFRIPEFLNVPVMPVALLLALLYTLTNHARYNEITAIRAAGISLWRLSLPYLAVGFAATVLLFVLNEFCVPRTGEIAEEIKNSQRRTADDQATVQDLAFVNTAEHRFWWAESYDKRTAEMKKPKVNWPSPEGGGARRLSAELGVYTNGCWTFYEVQQDLVPTNGFPTPLPSARVVVMYEFTETPEEIKSEININDRFGQQFRSRTRKADIALSEIVNFLRLHPTSEPRLRAWLKTKLHGARFAGPCVCVVVVLLAVPFAAMSGRRNVFVGVATSIVIFFVYYVVQQIGFSLGEACGAPAWLAAWLPNLLFAVTGLTMMAKVR